MERCDNDEVGDVHDREGDVHDTSEVGRLDVT